VELGYAAGSGTNASHGSGFWAAGIGAYRNQDADGVDVGFDTTLGGLLVGYDAEVSAGTRVGGFLGASTSRFETDANSQEIDADSYFGGIYAGFTGDSYFLDLAVTGGMSEQSSDRTITNNLVIGGLEHATADYDGLFISPSATIGTAFAITGGSLIPSLRARYAGLFLDSYDESGSAADLSVEDRDVNVFDFRAQLAYALAAKPVNDGTLHTAFRFGADAAFADNDNVEAALLGTALNFDVSGDDTVRGFGAVDLSYLTDSGSSFFLGAEAGYDSGDAFTLDVRGGFAVPL
jgi:outer membrane autotransporter protein